MGFNILHCRFYKGMGWEFEKNDFPAVKKFVENCHKYNIKALAYVQFSTLYYETLQAEIPDLLSWAAVDYSGKPQTYHGGEYYRWMPCIGKRPFIDYLKKIIKIGLEECPFDGIMFDNAHTYACYCPACQNEFRNYLGVHPAAKTLTGLPAFDHVLIPPPADDDQIKDPLRLLYVEYSTDKKKEIFKELHDFIKSFSPDYIVSANLGCIRRYSFSRQFALDAFKLKDCFDIIVSQSGNAPVWQENICINRIREHKLAQALGINILALSDHDGSLDIKNINSLLLNLAENFAWSGIPVERTIMAPHRQTGSTEPGIDKKKIYFSRFARFMENERTMPEVTDYCPVTILYSRESVNFSRLSCRAVMTTEEILLRSHIPFNLIAASAGADLKIPENCELLIIAEQYCLSDNQNKQIENWINAGGKLLITSKSGSCNENFRERRFFFSEILHKNSNVIIFHPVPNENNIIDDWTIKIRRPDNITEFASLVKSMINLPYSITAPESVMVNVKTSSSNNYFMHFLNYNAAINQKIRVKTLKKTRAELCFPFEETTHFFKQNNKFSFTMKTPYALLKFIK
ncbi:MAG TPA: hypothetical protein DC049_01460 [Spirochaetia bacterium]|nr:hypothetical protein [Spirochaetia bacterium]